MKKVYIITVGTGFVGNNAVRHDLKDVVNG